MMVVVHIVVELDASKVFRRSGTHVIVQVVVHVLKRNLTNPMSPAATAVELGDCAAWVLGDGNGTHM